MPRQKNSFFKVIYTALLGLSLLLTAMPIFRAGWAEAAPYVTAVNYLNPTTIDVVFSENMAAASTATTTAYTLRTAQVGGVTTTTSATLQPDNRTVRLIASDALITPSMRDSVTVKTGAGAPQNGSAQTQTTNWAVTPLLSKSSTVVISEVQTQGGSATDEFIELYNASSSAITLTNYSLKVINNTGTETALLNSFTATSTIPANGFFLITPASGYDGAVGADQTYGSGGIGANSTIVLYDGTATSTVKDLVGFGSAAVYEGFQSFNSGLSAGQPAAHASLERKAHKDATATSMGSGVDVAKGNSYDSNMNGWDFILRLTANPQNSASTIETLSGIVNNSGGIDHLPLYQVKATTDLIVLSRAMDPETPPKDLILQLKYKKAGSGTWTTVAGNHVANGFFTFKIPAGDIAQQSNSFIYYFKLTDTPAIPTGTAQVICFASTGTINDCASNETTAQTNAWSVHGVDASLWNNTISGFVKDVANNPIPGALVFLQGTGLNAVSGANGAFSLANVFNGSFNIVAIAGGYMDGMINGVSVNGGSISSGWTFNLNSGGGGMGGDMEKPHIVWSAPPDQMMSAPLDLALGTTPILLGFSKPMDLTSINTTNILLKEMSSTGTATDVTTSLGITIAYDDGAGVLISGTTYHFGTNVAALYSSSDLSGTKQYLVELLPAIKDNAGNSLEGNRPGGGHSVFFSTGGNFTSIQIQNNFGSGGQFMPPYVAGTSPMPGSFNVELNENIYIVFSQTMNSNTISNTTIKVYQVVSGTETLVGAAVSLDTNTKEIATVNPTSNLTGSGRYRVKVLGGCMSASGIQMSNPTTDPEGTQVFFTFDFETGTAADETGPTVKGTSLQIYSSGGTLSNVPVGLGVINIGFSEAVNPSTITSANITLKAGSTSVTGNVEYDPPSQSANFLPSAALSPNTTYVLTVGTGVQDGANIAMTSAYTQSFTTGSSDGTAPKIAFIDADNWVAIINFNEPMRAVTAADSQRWPGSALNPSNYTLRYGTSGTSFTKGSGGTLVSLTSATLSYKADYNTVKIEGLNLASSLVGQELWVLVENVTDLSGNAINTSYDEGRATIQNSQTTYGKMGPGDSGAMGPGGSGPNMGNMGMMGINVMPMNMMAGASTLYFMDMPLTKQIPNTGQIILTFPAGFGLANAIKDPYSPSVNDINGPGPGTPTISSVVGDDSAHTITLTLSGATGGTAGPDGFMDFLHIDIKQITNTSIPKGFDTSGYTVSLNTKNASGSVLESLTSMPFFINEGGQYIISGTVGVLGVTSVASSTPITIYLGSPMTGPTETAITLDNATSTTYSFASLPAGEFHLFTKSIITLSADGSSQDFMGSMMPEPIWVPDTASANYNAGTKTYTRNLSLRKSNIGAAITPKIYADFSSLSNAADRQIDIFSHSPSGFTVKTVTLNQSNYSVTPWNNNGSIKLYLPTTLASGIEIWRVGVGPAMSQGPMSMGSSTLPDWVPPGPQEVTVTGGAPPTGSPGTLSFTITQATHQIIGYIKDANDNPVPDAEVFAHQPMGNFGMPMHAKSNSTTGQFTLKVAPGTYSLGVFKPGLPPSPEMTVKVTDNNAANNAADSNTSADVYKEGGILVTDSGTLVLKVQKASFTVSGKVTDGTNPVAYAPVWAYSETTGAFVNTAADANGQYILYVNEGTWKAAAHIPGTGDLPPITVIVSAANCPNSQCTDQTIRPGVVSFAIVKGRVYASADATYNSGEEVTNAYVWLSGVDSSGNNFNNGLNVAPDGTYSLKSPGGSGYVAHAWTPSYGELAVISLGAVTAGTTYTSQDFRVNTGNVGTFTFSFSASGGVPSIKAYIDVYNASTALGSGLEFSDISATTTNKTLTLPIGNYNVFTQVTGLGKFASTDGNPITLTALGKALTFSLPALAARVTVSGRVFVDADTNGLYGGSDIAVGDALVWFDNPSSAIHHTTKSNTSSGLYSAVLPAGTYTVGVDAPGYSGATPTSIAFSTNTTRNFIVTANSNTISGSVKNVAGTKVPDAWVWATKVVSATDLTFNNGWVATVALGGDYTLSLTAGYWWAHAVADGYQESWLTSAVYAGGSTNPTSQDLTLTAMANYSVAKPTVKTMIPAKGGVVDDSAVSGIKLFFPPGALGTDTNNAKVTIRETYNIPQTRSQKPLGDKAYDVLVTDNSGTRISKFKEPIIMEVRYAESDLGSMDESALTYGFIDDSHQWAETNCVIDTTNNIIRVSLDHFSATAPTGPSDVSAPATPATPSGLGGVNAITVSWSANTEADLAGYEVYRHTASSGTFSNVSGDSYASGYFNAATLVQTSCNSGTCYWNDLTPVSGTTYYYKVSAFDTSGNYSASSLASAGVALSGGGGTTGGGGGRSGTPAVLQPEVSSAALTDGSVIKTADSDKVYVIKAGKRFWVRTSQAFETAGYQWSNIQTISPADLASKAEVSLFKATDSPKVYVIVNGMRRHIPSAQIFESYNYQWSEIVAVAKAEAEAYPEVNLVKLADDPSVYVLGKGLRRHIPSAEVFESYGYKWAEIITINATEMQTYGEAQLIKGIGNVKVYVIKNGKRHHIAAPAVFNSHGYNWEEIMEVNDTELAHYSEDAAVSE